MIVHLTVGLIKNNIVEISEYFQEPKSLGGIVNVELDLPNYATKTDLKNLTGVDTSSFAKQVHLVNLKSDVDKLDIDVLKTNLSNLRSKVDKFDVDKLIAGPVYLNKTKWCRKNDVVKKMYIMLSENILKIKYLTLLT